MQYLFLSAWSTASQTSIQWTVARHMVKQQCFYQLEPRVTVVYSQMPPVWINFSPKIFELFLFVNFICILEVVKTMLPSASLNHFFSWLFKLPEILLLKPGKLHSCHFRFRWLAWWSCLLYWSLDQLSAYWHAVVDGLGFKQSPSVWSGSD